MPGGWCGTHLNSSFHRSHVQTSCVLCPPRTCCSPFQRVLVSVVSLLFPPGETCNGTLRPLPPAYTRLRGHTGWHSWDIKPPQNWGGSSLQLHGRHGGRHTSPTQLPLPLSPALQLVTPGASVATANRTKGLPGFWTQSSYFMWFSNNAWQWYYFPPQFSED